jgi:N6-adenosine-specific RNA methylase IME4
VTDLFSHSVFGAIGGPFGCILADPPWRFRLYSPKGEEKSPQAQYATMSMEEIAALPVRGLANPEGCALVMWCTAPILGEAIDILRAWGFSYSSAGAWAKQGKAGGGWTFGTGYRYRSAAEFWLLGTIGQPEQLARNVRNLIVAPVREHSRKPDEMHQAIERQWRGPYLELFAREQRPGWVAWGNEVGKFNEAPA